MIDHVLVDRVPGETRVAALAGTRLVDLHIVRGDRHFAVGSIHLGRVAQVVAGFDGAFVDIGLEQAAFLRLGDAPAPPRPGDALVVQIVRAAGGEKGLGVTARPRLAGRHLDWLVGRPGLRAGRGVPLLPGLALAAEEGAELKPAAVDADTALVAAELARLRQQWAGLVAEAARTLAPAPLLAAPEPWLPLLLQPTAAVARISFADRATHMAARADAARRFPDLADRLVLDQAGWRLFDEAGVEEQVAAALARRVPLPGGGELVIDEGEAATLIDVDAGASRAGPGTINRKAVPAIAAALRLRAIGGQILVDFVHEGGAKARDALAAVVREAVAGDPEPVEIAGWSRLGFLEMTRRRARPSLSSLLAAPVADRAPSALARGYDALRAAARTAAGPAVVAIAIEAGREVEAVLRGPLAADLAVLAEAAIVTIRIAPAPALAAAEFRIAPGRP
ncbi:ribonuclease G [Allostella vacuolata]|nr:ribonuclease G [Stella vacuolata]